MNAAEYAQRQGVLGILIVPDFQYLANWDRNRTRITERGSMKVDKFQSPSAAQMPQLVISPRVANVLFQGERRGAVALFESVYGGQPVERFRAQSGQNIFADGKSEIRTSDHAKRRGGV